VIPTSGNINLDHINAEFGRPAGSPATFNDPGVRMLTRDDAKLAASTPISLSDLRGGRGFAMTCFMRDQGSGIIGAIAGDGVNASPLGAYKDGTVKEISTGRVESGLAIGLVTTVYANGPVVGPTFYDHFTYMGVWNASRTYLGMLKMSQAKYFVADATRNLHGSGFLAGETIDLRPYLNTWLTFVFFSS